MKGMIRWYISKQNRLMLLSVWSVGVKKKLMFIESLRDLLRKSNKIVHKFSWVEMSGLHLRQSSFHYSSCGPFTKPCERIQKFREMGNLKRLYRIELDKVCYS